MNEGPWSTILCATIFIVCLFLLPGAPGFFLALLIIVVLGVVISGYRSQEDARPFPDQAILTLHPPKPDKDESTGLTEPKNRGGYEVPLHPTSNGQPTDYSRYLLTKEQFQEHWRHQNEEKRDLPTPTTPDNTLKGPQYSADSASVKDNLDLPLQALSVFLFYALAFGFLFLLGTSPMFFSIFVALFWFVVICSLLTVITILLGGWKALAVTAGISAIYLTIHLFTHISQSGWTALTCATAWLATCIATRKYLKGQRKTTSFWYILAKNATELFIIFGLTAAFAMLLPIVFRRVPLSVILRWRYEIIALKDLLKKLTIGSGTALGLVIGLFVLTRGMPTSRLGTSLELTWKR